MNDKRLEANEERVVYGGLESDEHSMVSGSPKQIEPQSLGLPEIVERWLRKKRL